MNNRAYSHVCTCSGACRPTCSKVPSHFGPAPATIRNAVHVRGVECHGLVRRHVLPGKRRNSHQLVGVAALGGPWYVRLVCMCVCLCDKCVCVCVCVCLLEQPFESWLRGLVYIVCIVYRNWIRLLSQECMYACICTPQETHLHSCSDMHSYVHISRCAVCTCLCVCLYNIYTYACIYIYTQTHMQKIIHTHAHTHTHTHTNQTAWVCDGCNNFTREKALCCPWCQPTART